MASFKKPVRISAIYSTPAPVAGRHRPAPARSSYPYRNAARTVAEKSDHASRLASVRTLAMSLAGCDRIPCFRLFLLAFALPLAVLGPVDFSQGFNCRISSACLARRSGVQAAIVPPPSSFDGFPRCRIAARSSFRRTKYSPCPRRHVDNC